jgi:hypothetical protein
VTATPAIQAEVGDPHLRVDKLWLYSYFSNIVDRNLGQLPFCSRLGTVQSKIFVLVSNSGPVSAVIQMLFSSLRRGNPKDSCEKKRHVADNFLQKQQINTAGLLREGWVRNRRAARLSIASSSPPCK